MGEKSYDAANERLIAREERKLDRQREKLEATEKHLRKSLAQELSKNKQAIAKDALNATKDGNRRNTSSDLEGYLDDGEVVTGYEDRVWERD